MIVRERPGFFEVIFSFRNSIIGKVYPKILMVSSVSLLIVWAHRSAPAWFPVFSGAPLALLGVALSVFLGFRNSACYDRWWEARKQWGQLVVTSRDLARQTLMLEERGASAKRREILHLVIAFAHALVAYLRPAAPSAKPGTDLSLPDEPLQATPLSLPERIVQRLGSILAKLRAEGALCGMEYAAIDGSLAHMNGVLGACERIRGTPVPFGYTMLLMRTAYLVCFLVPFGFADILGWTTPLVAAVFAYTFFGLDALGYELEEPFGVQANDLPIGSMAVNIEISLRSALGEKDLPARPEPTGDVLM